MKPCEHAQLAALAALLLAAAACGDDRAAGAVAPAVPMQPAEPAPARDEVLTFTLGGIERTVLLHVPAETLEMAAAAAPTAAPAAKAAAPVAATAKKWPLVLDLHPSGGTAESQRAATQLVALADREGFVVAYPQGAIAHDQGFQWHVPGAPLVGGAPEPQGPDDVAFIAEAIARIERALGPGRLDRGRIYATGFSGGARMSSSLGCALPEIAAIAPIGGVRAPEPCPRTGLSVLAFHGTLDQTNGYSGPTSGTWTYGVAEAMQRWAARNGCAAEPEVTRPAATVELRTFTGCAGGASLQLYSLEGEAHELPRAVFAGELMWKAFRAR